MGTAETEWSLSSAPDDDNGGVLLSGACPECGHNFTYPMPVTRMGGAHGARHMGQDQDETIEGQWVTVICRCGEHEGKGCGAAGQTWVTVGEGER